jgi:hypothetical protein
MARTKAKAIPIYMAKHHDLVQAGETDMQCIAKIGIKHGSRAEFRELRRRD